MASQKGSVETTEWPAAATGKGGDVTTVEPSADANVDKIREILFGGQMQDYELRFTALEDRLAAAAAELREETRTRLDALEAYAKREIGALGDRVDALGERAASDGRDLRDQLVQQSKALGDDLHRVREALAEIAQEAGTLRTTTTDRQLLAGLLADVAMRLSDPGAAEGEGA